MKRQSPLRPSGTAGAGPADHPTGKPCPVCGKSGMRRHDPFCSQRCRDVDLHRWLGGAYAIPADDPLPDEEGGEG